MGASQDPVAASIWGLTLSSLTPPPPSRDPAQSSCICELPIKYLPSSGPASRPPLGQGSGWRACGGRAVEALGSPLNPCLGILGPECCIQLTFPGEVRPIIQVVSSVHCAFRD